MLTPSPLAAETSRRAPVIKILDMGLARVTTADEGLEAGLTSAGEFVGTPDYAAPEQAEDSAAANIRADLYSLGATWFYLLTGKVPYPGVSLMQKLRRMLTQPTPLVTDDMSKSMESDPAGMMNSEPLVVLVMGLMV